MHGIGNHEVAQHRCEHHNEQHAQRSQPPVGIQRYIRQQSCLADVADGKRNDGNARHEENPLHLRDGRILLRHLARDEQVDHPRQDTQQGERDAQQVVTAGARLPAHEHHQRSTRDGQQHTDGLHARDALA